MLLNFKKFANEAEAYINELARRLGTPDDRNRAARIFRNVLHLLRDQITPQESMQLVSQLPMFIKAIYIDGWKIGGKPNRIRRLDTFIDEVRYPPAVKVYSDFDTNEEAEDAARIIFNMLCEKVSDGEIQDMLSTMPSALRVLFPSKVSDH